jgi:uncharacterized protein DUF5677
MMRFVEVPPIRIDFPLLQQTEDLWDFSVPGFELLARCGMLCDELIGSVNRRTKQGDRRLSLDEAVVGGLLVRMAKLCRAIFDSTQSEQSEVHSPLTRIAAETAITLRWLVKADDPTSYRRFRADSFVYFRESGPYSADPSEADEMDDALASIIRNEIDQRLACAGLKWEDVPERDQSWGPDVRQRFEAFDQGSLYRALFKSHSAYIHPTWHEISALHLERRDDGFVLDDSCAEMMPIAAYVLARILAEATLDAARALPHDLDEASLTEIVQRTVEGAEHLSMAFAEFAERVGFDVEFMR